jgi:hypothetical protein
MKKYKDEKFCEHCGKDTLHLIHDTEHERDSSRDYFECLVCRWWGFGILGKYNPPTEVDFN